MSSGTLWGPARALEGTIPGPTSALSGAEVVELARRDTALVSRLRVRLARRFFVREWARQHDVNCPSEARDAFRTWWESTRGIDSGGCWLRANGLTAAVYDRLLAERALVHWAACRNEASTVVGEERRLALAWAQDNGVASEAVASATAQEELVDWLLDRGPAYFGLRWNEDLALLEELQMVDVVLIKAHLGDG